MNTPLTITSGRKNNTKDLESNSENEYCKMSLTPYLTLIIMYIVNFLTIAISILYLITIISIILILITSVKLFLTYVYCVDHTIDVVINKAF